MKCSTTITAFRRPTQDILFSLWSVYLLKMGQLWLKTKAKLNKRKICSVFSSMPQFYSRYAKILLLIVLNLYPCVQSYGQREQLPPVLYWIIAYNYIIAHICLQTALHPHKSVPFLAETGQEYSHLFVKNSNARYSSEFILSHNTTQCKPCKEVTSESYTCYKKLEICL